MFVKSENHIRFSRKKNIVFEETKLNKGTLKVPLFVLQQNFPDVDNIQKLGIEYLEKYIKMFPELAQKIKQ